MIRVIKLNNKQKVNYSYIRSILIDAKMTYDYAKFIMSDGRYIQVNFTRDNKYEISTDCREQYQLFYDIKILKSINNFNELISFVVKWLNKLNK